MITASIFAGHIIFAAIIFRKKWKSDGPSGAFMNLALIAILFTVGWTIVTMITKLFIEPKGFGTLLDRDAISLCILSIGEYFFYKFYYGEKPTEDDTEKQ